MFISVSNGGVTSATPLTDAKTKTKRVESCVNKFTVLNYRSKPKCVVGVHAVTS